ncbi:uncharacterized protein LOC133176760 [Saccostrea echinata]|uniref:uncharacterized protein LOC133176760 n=1 Tax=Saccostrea echinata TaxID=191078 RepID=UPI002A81CB02|nr:uncharacterized protein LOC133176760 [Saccostrea echinata]
MEHRQCDSVEAIEKASQTFKESGKLESILESVKQLKQKLMGAKEEQEKNITELEDTLDKITKETEKEVNDVVRLIERLKTEHLQEVTSAVKKGKEMLNRIVLTVSDGINCADKPSSMIKCSTAMHTFQQLEKVKFQTSKIHILTDREPVLKEIGNICKIGKVNVNEFVQDVSKANFDVRNILLSSVTEVKIREGRCRNGIFLSNTQLIFTDSKGKKLLYGELAEKEWTWIKNIEPLDDPFCLLLNGDELVVACVGSKSIEAFSISDFRKLRSIKMNMKIFGLSHMKGYFYGACGNKIVRFDNLGNIINELETSGQNAMNVITTDCGLIVYSDWKMDSVTAITEQGDTVWNYTSLDLKCPYGLEIDLLENMYVAGMHSNNIHVISSTGELVRLFQNIIKNPVFMKMNDERSMCCVCSNYETIKFFEMK